MSLLATDQFDQRLLELVNQERAKIGINSVSLSQELDQAADKYANRMATGDFFSHTDAQTGSTVETRVTSEGYQWTTVGENIAAGQTTAEKVFEFWMNSAAHRANILNPNFTQMGVGYTYLVNDTGNVNYQRYWSQVFAAGDPNPGTYVAEIDPLSGLNIIGTNSNNSLSGGNLKDIITGGLGSDQLFGGAGDDILTGVNPTVANPGKGEIDSLTGGAGFDTFVLGDSTKAYYNDCVANNQGKGDYARIKDFTLGEDNIQLYSGNSYAFGNSPSGLPSGTAIYLKDTNNTLELIGIIEGVSASTVVNNSKSVFTFV